MKPDDFMTLPELAEYLQVHPVTIYRMLRRKQISGLKVGGDWRFFRDEIEHLITDRAEVRLRNAR